jgi:hypothetical protein
MPSAMFGRWDVWSMRWWPFGLPSEPTTWSSSTPRFKKEYTSPCLSSIHKIWGLLLGCVWEYCPLKEYRQLTCCSILSLSATWLRLRSNRRTTVRLVSVICSKRSSCQRIWRVWRRRFRVQNTTSPVRVRTLSGSLKGLTPLISSDRRFLKLFRLLKWTVGITRWSSTLLCIDHRIMFRERWTRKDRNRRAVVSFSGWKGITQWRLFVKGWSLITPSTIAGEKTAVGRWFPKNCLGRWVDKIGKLLVLSITRSTSKRK